MSETAAIMLLTHGGYREEIYEKFSDLCFADSCSDATDICLGVGYPNAPSLMRADEVDCVHGTWKRRFIVNLNSDELLGDHR